MKARGYLKISLLRSKVIRKLSNIHRLIGEPDRGHQLPGNNVTGRRLKKKKRDRYAFRRTSRRVIPFGNGMRGNDSAGDTYLPSRWSPTRGSRKTKILDRVHLVLRSPLYIIRSSLASLRRQRGYARRGHHARHRKTHVPDMLGPVKR